MQHAIRRIPNLVFTVLRRRILGCLRGTAHLVFTVTRRRLLGCLRHDLLDLKLPRVLYGRGNGLEASPCITGYHINAWNDPVRVLIITSTQSYQWLQSPEDTTVCIAKCSAHDQILTPLYPLGEAVVWSSEPLKGRGTCKG